MAMVEMVMSDSIIKGPRPLSLHFSNSQVIWGAAGEGATAALDRGHWHQCVAQSVAMLKTKLGGSENQMAFDRLVREKADARKEKFLTGINAYLSKDYQRPKCQADVCFEVGGVRLLDFGGNGAPILMIPSLINPHYILDLMPGRSLATFLKEQGYRPFLVSWGAPGEEEVDFGLDDYISRRLMPALDYVCAIDNHAVPVIGYCMGGTLSVALAARTAGQVSKLSLLAAPWDFGGEHPHAGRKFVPAMVEHMENLPHGGSVGVDMLQTFFASVDPTLNDRKFRRYAAGDYKGKQADFFSAMEVWANNGAPLARQVAAECMKGWYRDNDTMAERWTIAGASVKLSDIKCPVWVAAPEGDRLVPQQSAYAILEGLNDGTAHAPPSGHIGMVVGDRAKEGLWQPMVEWMEAN